MKLSKIIICMGMFASIISITFAGEITLNPATGDMGDGCRVAVNVMADTQGKNVAATDVIMESSLDFVDFVPGDAFPYFLPPKVESNVVHIVGFAVESSQRMSGKHKLGTAYFQKRNIGDRDGAIRLYFTKVGDTIDSNLSIAGGIDTLEKVTGAEYTFDGTTECVHKVASVEGGIKNISLDTTLQKIMTDIPSRTSGYLYWFGGLLLLIITGLIYFATARKGKKAA